jgi:sulfoxide reductase heme-binding subunit YedZ
MNWLRTNWRWAILNGAAVVILLVLLTRGSTDINKRFYTFDPTLESAKWAIRFLLFSLAMSPLNTYFGWRSAIKLRKPAGLWAFGFAALHFLLEITDTVFQGIHWLWLPIEPFIIFGLIGLLILSAMAMTSNQWAMKRLGKRWKRLHRLVYVAGMAIVYHAVLATSSSKRMFINAPDAIYEIHIYLVILTILLLIRIPLIRSGLKRLANIRVLPNARLTE